MKILSHRGCWKTPQEKNTVEAFERSFKLGFGTETDVRDHGGNLLISHDMPNGFEMQLEEFLDIFRDRDFPLAINIKADGLAEKINIIFKNKNIKNWFVFDMSIPDTRSHFAIGNPVFVRMSEFELSPPWIDIADGIWLDSFEAIWYDTDFIKGLLNKNKQVCIVSSELHKINESEQWRIIKPLTHFENLMICTDKPEEAKKYFLESRID